VVKIKGLIIIEKLSFVNKMKSMIGLYSSEIKEYKGKEVFILKTDKYNDTVRKRFIRRRIRELAVFPENKVNRELLSGEGFYLLTRERIFIKHIDAIIRKYALSSGIEKGKLVLGVAVNDPTELLKKLTKIGDYLSEVHLYGKKSGRSLKAADSFFEETGISVILTETPKESSCDILIKGRDTEICLNRFSGTVIPLGETEALIGEKAVKGVKVSLPKELLKIGVDDITIAELFDLELKISGFVTEKQKNT